MSRLGIRTLLGVVLTLLAASPAMARRRAVGFPSSSCAWEVLERNISSNSVVIDGDLLYYFNDDTGQIWRMPKAGGEKQLLATASSFPVLMAFDATRLYFATLEEEDLSAAVWSIPKSGGQPQLLADDVIFPRDLKTDATHVYWSSYGTIDDEGMFRDDGRIERIRKDGTGRTIMAGELAFPSEIALDDTYVYFGVAGLSSTILGGLPTGGGLQRAPKSGGPAEVIVPDVPIFTLAGDSDALYFETIDIARGFLLDRLVKSTGARQTLYVGVFFAIDLHPANGKVVYYHVTDENEGFAEIDVATRVIRFLVPGADLLSSFAVDECALYFSTTFFGTAEPQLLRAPR